MELGERYLRGRERVVSLVAGLDEAGWVTAVPACPGWRIHDLVAHLVGITDDALAGRMEGAPGPAWTAAQVADRVDAAPAGMLAEWDANAERFAEALTAFGIATAVVDVLTHEQDLRGALGRPGGDPADLSWVVDALLDRLHAQVAEAGLPALAVRTERGNRVLADGEVGASLRTTDLELFRASLGRRSAAQILALDWDGDAGPYLPHLSVFDLHPTDLVE
jgi:uncharacterized protein (TIGR03083 family)